MTLRRLIWRFLYAMHWNKTTKMGLRYSWYLATIHCKTFYEKDFVDECPIHSADEELGYWRE